MFTIDKITAFFGLSTSNNVSTITKPEEVKMDNRVHLKIKLKTLAEEARIIRKEERKYRGMKKWELQNHRKTVVRDAARRTLIAYQFIRGRDWIAHVPMLDAESFIMHQDLKAIESMVKKYGSAEAIASLPKLGAWYREAAYTRRSGGNYERRTEDTHRHAAG